jgi:hypothetical protein
LIGLGLGCFPFLFFVFFLSKLPPLCKCWKLLFIGKYIARSSNLVPQLLSFCKFDFFLNFFVFFENEQYHRRLDEENQWF